MIRAKTRAAFSMVTAIVVILVMSGLLALVSNLAGKIVKETAAQYRKEQAAILAKSYTEFALLSIQGSGMGPTAGGGKPCLRTITANINSFDGSVIANATARGEGYHVEVKMQYIGLPNTYSCNSTNAGKGSLGRLATSTSGDISVTIDVYVQYHDIGMVNSGDASRWVTYHRRTLQKL